MSGDTRSDSQEGGGAPRERAPANPAPFAPFEVLRTERIYDSPWCGLRRDVLRLDDGREQEHHVFEVGDAVCVLPIRADGQVVMIGQFRHPHGKTHWEVPAGRMNVGEAPEEAAARELREETGYRAGRLVRMPGFHPTNGISAHWSFLFVALDCELEGELELDPCERLIVQTFTQSQCGALLREGRIEDGFSALALLYGFQLGHLQARPMTPPAAR
ncbi:MAG: NUDIX hydrolase [Planctomycetota bacterium]